MSKDLQSTPPKDVLGMSTVSRILSIQGSAVYPTKGCTRDVHGILGYLVSRDLQSTPPRDVLGMSTVSQDT